MRKIAIQKTLAIKPLVFASIFAIVGTTAMSASASVVSNFNTGTEGWTLANSDPDSTLTWQASGGNPGGYVLFNDAAVGAFDDFSAPAKFLGNDSQYVNATLSFDLIHNEPGEEVARNPVTINDASGDSISLVITAPPINAWTSYSLALDTSAGWLFDGGGVATQNQISTVLADVSSIWLPADIHGGTEQTGLDNVSLVPEPASLGLLTIGAAGLLIRPRSVHR